MLRLGSQKEPLIPSSIPPWVPAGLVPALGQGERNEEFFGKEDKVLQILELRHKGNFCGFQAGSSPPE